MDLVISEILLWFERIETSFQSNSFNKYMSTVLNKASLHNKNKQYSL